jgi:hypothetical protein
MTSYDDAAAKAQAHLDRASKQYAAIDANESLTAEGKAEQRQSVYDNTDAVVTKLREDSARDTEVRIRQLTKSLFGGNRLDGASAQAASAAADRAAAIDSAEEAKRVVQDAELSGNDYLSKAVVHKALEAYLENDMFGAPWGEVVNLWCDGHPSREEAVRKLVELRSPSKSGPFAAMAFVVPTPPGVKSTSFGSW